MREGVLGGIGQSENLDNNSGDPTNLTQVIGGDGATGAVDPSNSSIFIGAGGAAGDSSATTETNPAGGYANGEAIASSAAGGIIAEFFLAQTGGNGTIGGAGGNSYARSTAVNTAASGSAYAQSYARAGAGGFSQTAGQFGGAGGVATVGLTTASGYSAMAEVDQFAGPGGGGLEYSGALGANGVNSKIVNKVGGSTTGGANSRLQLGQSAEGGSGGFSPVAAGQGGYGKSYLTFDDNSANAKQASALYGSSTAIGGGGGSIWANPAAATAGAGGAAAAYVNMTGAHQVEASAEAEGRYGGSNIPGAKAAYAAGGDGGAGGVATVTGAKAYNTATSGVGYHGVAGASGTATGGAGGSGSGAGFMGGAGGAAIVGPVYARGYSAAASARQTGGGGGQGQNGAGAGDGANSLLDNDVSGRTAGGTHSYLALNQYAEGGGVGQSLGGGAAGTAGYGKSYLTFDDTKNPNHATSFTAYSEAAGGAGGSAYANQGTAGGVAKATGNFYGAGAMNVRSAATGGAGGSTNETLGGGVSADGGAASAKTYAHSATTGDQSVSAGARAGGGGGGGVASVTGDGGQGGAATGAFAGAYAPNALGEVSAGASQTGGAGGSGDGAGFSGGDGGLASDTVAYAQGGASVVVSAYQTGGGGGSGSNGAVGGAGANSRIGGVNSDGFAYVNVSGVASAGGYLELKQSATGGNGGVGALGGQGGSGYSSLNFDDTKNKTQAKTLTGRVYATGGNSGMTVGGGLAGATADSGGAGSAYLNLTGAGAVNGFTTNAAGGAGGGIDGGPENGGAGGNAIGKATATSVASTGAYNVTNDIFVTGGGGGEVFNGGTGNGGAGGSASGYGKSVDGSNEDAAFVSLEVTGGKGGAVSLASGGAGQSAGAGGAILDGKGPQAVAIGRSANAEVVQTGGSGGAGSGGANGGAGASVDLVNGVAGTANGGTLSLTQIVSGGSGGASAGGTAGAAGYGKSYLNYADKAGTASQLTGNSQAIGGGGGAGQGGASGASGGFAYASDRLAGAQAVDANASADGGAGGGVSGTGAAAAGGNAGGYAYADAAGTKGASAAANVRGGVGGGAYSGATVSGAAGGSATGATAKAIGGGAAVAEATQIGGYGGAGVGAGHSGGQGGTATQTYAKAYGRYATAGASQTGGAGGGGTKGASGGAGANSILDNALTATTSGGAMDLNQNATGGAGGESSGGAGVMGGLGGYGKSTLNFSTIGDASQPDAVNGSVSGVGGAGGRGASGGVSNNGGAGYGYITLTGVNTVSATATGQGGYAGPGATGGKAVAQATAISTTGTATASATATGGGAGLGGTQGDANAVALAETSNGQQATATAYVDGDASIQATAESTMTGHVTAISAATSQTGSGDLSMTSTVNSAGILAELSPYSPSNTAFAGALPAASTINLFLNGDTTLNNLIGSADPNATDLVYGLQSGVAQTGASGAQVVTSTDDFTLDATGLTGNLVMGLIGSQAWGSGVSDIKLTVTFGGVTEVSEEFATVAAAESYFADNVALSEAVSALPAGPLQVGVTLAVTSSTGGGGFGDDFVFATTGVNGPLTINTGTGSTVGVNQSDAISGVSVAESGDLAGVVFTATLTDATGLLTVTPGSATVAGNDSDDLTVSGTLTQVNAALATLADDNVAPGSDSISIKVGDGTNNAVGVESVTVNGAPQWSAPTSALVETKAAQAVTSVSLSETGNVASGETFAVTIGDASGKLAVSGGGLTVAGENSDSLSFAGTLAQVNAALASLTVNEASAGSDTITLKAKDSLGNSTSNTIGLTAYPAPSAPVISEYEPPRAPALSVDIATPVNVLNAAGTLYGPIAITENGAIAGETFTVKVTDSGGTLSDADTTDVTYTLGEPSNTLQFTGTLAQVNAALGELDATNVTDGDWTGPTTFAQAGIAVDVTDSFGNSATPVTTPLYILDSQAEFSALDTLADFQALKAAGVTNIPLTNTSQPALTLDQANWLIAEGLTISSGYSIQLSLAGAEVASSLSAAAIATLPDLFGTNLAPGIPYFPAVEIYCNDGQLELSASEIQAIEALNAAGNYISVGALNGQTFLTDSAANVETFAAGLTPTQIAALNNLNLAGVLFTDGAVALDVAQAQALEPLGLRLSMQDGTAVTLQDTASAVQNLIDAGYGWLTTLGVYNVQATGGGLQFTIAQAEALAKTGVNFTVSAGDALSLQDTGANIAALLNDVAVNGDAGQISAIAASLGVSTLIADDGPLTITAAEAVALVTSNTDHFQSIALSSQGDGVIIQDSATDLENMSLTDWRQLSAIGVTGIDVTGAGATLTLTVAEAQAILDPITITTQPGGQVIVTGSETDIESLNPQDLAQLTSLGVTDYQVQADPSTGVGLSGAGDLIIAAGETVTVAGTISATQAITFAGGDGVFAPADASDMQGTIYAFQPTDAIDLTGAAFGLTAPPLLGADNVLQIVETSGTYNIQFDPNQDFVDFNQAFVAQPDANGGTELILHQSPVYDDVDLASGENAYGAEIGNGGGVYVENGATLGATLVDSGAFVTVYGGGIADNLTLDGGELDNYGSVNGTLVENGGELDDYSSDAGTIVGAGGFLEDYEPTTGTTLQAGGEADIYGDYDGILDVISAAAGSVINFEDAYGVASLDNPAAFGATIEGFQQGDGIDLSSIAYDPAGSADLLSGNVLQITENGDAIDLQLDPNANFAGDEFFLSPDNSQNGTEVTESAVPCYCRGALIRTETGERPVETLVVGDRLVTLSGALRPIKWIGTRSYDGRFVAGNRDILPICVHAGALGENVPARELWLSPHHALYLEGVLIEAKDLVNGVNIVQATKVERVDYFHIELVRHDVIFAEGAPAETFIDNDSRAMFANASDYAKLYPGKRRRQKSFAPRRDEGFEIETARQDIAARAGIVAAFGPGELRGWIEGASSDSLWGWAQDSGDPQKPVCLHVLADGCVIGRVLANGFRADLLEAGLGNGRCAFRFEAPKGVDLLRARIELRRDSDGAPVPCPAQFAA